MQTNRRPLAKAILGVLLAASAGSVLAEENVMLVLDASGSMWGQIDGVSKIEIARGTVATLVEGWKPENNLGLVTYGHRRKGDCADIETLVDVGPLDASGYLARVNALNPKGMTPLSAAVVQAAEGLRSSEQKATVILVSDGEETCNLDPCAIGAELESSGVDFTAHVIGFDVSDPAHQAQLRCLAENTGGQYFSASSASELAGSLSAVIAASTEPALPPASATIDAPASVTIATRFDVGVDGPADTGDYIAFYDGAGEDARESTYAMLENIDAEGRLQINSPAEPGSYEIRYVSPRRAERWLGSSAIEVTDAQASIEAPDSVAAGISLQFRAEGPQGPRHWVGFAPAGSSAGSYRSFARPNAEGSYSLKTPAEPGEYELRYVLNESERVLASHPIRVTDAGASISGPDEASAGTTIEVSASGPVANGHWIGFAPAGSSAGTYRHYVRPQEGQSTYTLNTPAEAGDYELRYVLDESAQVAASQPIRVAAAQVRLEAPDEVAAGSSVEVVAEGPFARGHWVGFAPAGSAPGAYLDYTYIKAGISDYRLSAPDAPGDYEIRYVLYERAAVAARRAVRVRAAD